MELKLTDVERLILANQYEILAALNDGDVGYTRLATQLREGHEWLYKQSLGWLRPVMPDVDARFVLAVLDLHNNLAVSVAALPNQAGFTASDIRFAGFDGNDDYEIKLLKFVRALADEGKWGELLEDRAGLNASCTMAPNYRRMLAKYAELGKPSQLNQTQIEAILTAKRHPG